MFIVYFVIHYCLGVSSMLFGLDIFINCTLNINGTCDQLGDGHGLYWNFSAACRLPRTSSVAWWKKVCRYQLCSVIKCFNIYTHILLVYKFW